MNSQIDLEQKARELLDHSGVLRPPVPVEKIARLLDIDVRYSPTRDDVSGALIREGNSSVIAVNSAQHENRQRFTIAHEIGHFLLHKGVRLHFDDDFRVNFRSSKSADASSVEEMQANSFAAALLMPREALNRDVLRMRFTGSDLVNALATKYKVSSRAMELRLMNLGYLSPIE